MTRLTLTRLLALGLASTTLAQNLRLFLPIGHISMSHSAQFSPDGNSIVTISQDNTAKVCLGERQVLSASGGGDIARKIAAALDGQ